MTPATRRQTVPGPPSGPWDKITAAIVAVAVLRSLRDRRKQITTPVEDDGPHPEPATENTPPAFLAKIDRYQRQRPLLAFPIAVLKKFGEDKAGYLAALVAYFGFFSLFPLMLAFTSVLGFVITDPDKQREFSDAAADQIPIIGDIIRRTAGSLEGSVIAIVLGLLLALWSGLRIVDAMQNALNEVWDLPRIARPKLLKRRLKGIVMLLLIGGSLVASIAASNIATIVDVIPGGGKVTIWAASVLVSIILYFLAFQLLTDTSLPWRELWPGAIFAGAAWWALQTFGSAYIIRQQQAAGEAYGQFSSIIALLAFLFIAAQFSILGAEISAVKARHLWPRSIVKGDHTEADLAAFRQLAASTRQEESYEVVVRFKEPAPAPDAAPPPPTGS